MSYIWGSSPAYTMLAKNVVTDVSPGANARIRTLRLHDTSESRSFLARSSPLNGTLPSVLRFRRIPACPRYARKTLSRPPSVCRSRSRHASLTLDHRSPLLPSVSYSCKEFAHLGNRSALPSGRFGDVFILPHPTENRKLAYGRIIRHYRP